MPDLSGPPGWGLGGGLISRSRKKKYLSETETRTTTAPYQEAEVQDVNMCHHSDHNFDPNRILRF